MSRWLQLFYLRLRQGKPEIRTLTRLSIDPNLAAVGFDHPPGDGQAQAGAGFAAGGPGRKPGKILEQKLPVFLGDSRIFVGHVDAPAPWYQVGTNRDGSSA
jgi:hypothetical protein